MTDPGIEFLDHTADVGIDVAAPDLRVLFHRAAVGLLALLYGRDDDPQGPRQASTGSGSETELDLEARDRADLLARWLKEVLFFHEAQQRDYRSARFQVLEDTALRATVVTEPAGAPVREIKGVTYHELEVTETGNGWSARVIFDV